jgi:hypothetical protein
MIHQKIRTVLNVNYTEYSNYRHCCFTHWCVKQAHKTQLCQRILIKHDGLYNWYCDQWNTIVENLFYEDNKHYIESNVKHPGYWDLFKDYPPIVLEYFPGVLLTMIKKEHNTIRHELN